MCPEILQQENLFYRNTGGVSQNNRDLGFHSAFQDRATGRVYLSRFADGCPAPIHLLEGLPEELAEGHDAGGRITSVKRTVIAGFLRADRFYTREEAAQALAGSGS